MLKFNEEQQIKDIRGALALRSDVEKVVDQVWTKGFDAVYYLGIGGTYASAMQAVTYANGKSNLPIYVQHAAEYYTTGNKRLTENHSSSCLPLLGQHKKWCKPFKKSKRSAQRYLVLSMQKTVF